MVDYDPINYRAEIEHGELDATTEAAELGLGQFHYVNIQNPLFTFAAVANATNIFVGTGSRQRWILRPGESTDWWPIESLKDIFVRTAAGAVTVPYLACRLTVRNKGKGCGCEK